MFRFKQFSVNDDRSTMKVGTDAVLLGAWVAIGNAKNILDVGTGCGVIALMLAQRSAANIDAVEPDKSSAEQAEANFKASPWTAEIHNTAIQEFDHAPYDLIVSNPPFFSKSLLPPADTRRTARHTESLSFDELLHATKRLLHEDGRLAVVLPVVEGNEFRAKAFEYGLHCVRSLAFYSRANKPQERWLFEFSRVEKIPEKENLILYDGERWSDAYRKLTQDFYLGTF